MTSSPQLPQLRPRPGCAAPAPRRATEASALAHPPAAGLAVGLSFGLASRLALLAVAASACTAATAADPRPPRGLAASVDGGLDASTAASTVMPPADDAATSSGGDAALERADTSADPHARALLLARLRRLNHSGTFLFGQENATLWGMYLDGALVSTNTWFESTARAGHFTSDSEAVVKDAPAVLGVGLDMLAFEPTDWNRRAATAAAMRNHLRRGGVVTLDWHAPSCNANPGGEPSPPIAVVNVGAEEVTLRRLPGGAWFYAEEDYRRPIKTVADVPETLKCLCQIANDQPLTAGPYLGDTGKAWLVAHAKQAAAVLREQGLADQPLIIRPFHEHTGSWFWWGEPYWNCAALLGRRDALSGPAAYKEMVRTFILALRSEPGMSNLLFAYSPDNLKGPRERERWSASEKKVMDPQGTARDILRERLVRELEAAGLGFVSPSQRTDQRRRHYSEAYAGDDVFDVLGMDLYHPAARAATDEDRRRFGVQLRVLQDEARAHDKPYAWTEAGTYRLHLVALGSTAPAGEPVLLNDQKTVEEALGHLFDPDDRTRLLQHFGLREPGPVVLSAAERAAVLPRGPEDWFNRQLLPLARAAKVAYALVWQTYYDKEAAAHRTFSYYVPYPGHPEAASFARFYAHPATCFLGDPCGRP